MASKHKKRKGKNKFIMLERWLYQCPAWRACTPNERAAYLEFKDRYNGTNNGMIALSARELGEALHTSKDTASRTIKALEKKGFIRIVKQSAFSVKTRMAAEYQLTEYGCDITGALASKDFMRWQPENKQRSDDRDTQSDDRDSQAREPLQNHAHGPMTGTVVPLKPRTAVR